MILIRYVGQLTAVDVRDGNERICDGEESTEHWALGTGHWVLSRGQRVATVSVGWYSMVCYGFLPNILNIYLKYFI